MQDFTVKTRLTAREYSKIMFIGLYKKPVFILATILGLYMITTVVLDYLCVIDFYTEIPYFEIIGSIFLLLGPLFIVLIALRQFNSNPALQNEITYTFGENSIAMQGSTFKSEFLWSHIIKQKEFKNFLILYHDKKFGNFIDKTKLTEEQLEFIKSKVGQK